jgi:hypothetical protein
VKNRLRIRLNRPCRIQKAKSYSRVVFALFLYNIEEGN